MKLLHTLKILESDETVNITAVLLYVTLLIVVTQPVTLTTVALVSAALIAQGFKRFLTFKTALRNEKNGTLAAELEAKIKELDERSKEVQATIKAVSELQANVAGLNSAMIAAQKLGF